MVSILLFAHVGDRAQSAGLSAGYPVMNFQRKMFKSFFRIASQKRFVSLQPRLKAAQILPDGLNVSWFDGRQRKFHFEWLFRNRPESILTTGQNAANPLESPPAQFDSFNAIIGDDGESLKLFWGRGDPSRFSSRFLLRFAQPDVVKKLSDPRMLPIPLRIRAGVEGIPSVPFLELKAEKGLLEFLETLNQDGVCVVSGVPTNENNVLELARCIGPVMHTIYGEIFDVEAVPDPINIAYSPLELSLHQDLAYYESPPGLQLLHCLRFDSGVLGGESTFADTFHIVSLLREQDPDAFDVLTRIPATFQKVHYERSRPVHLTYRRPHIALNHRREVVGVFWAPAFEGPLQASEEDTAAYVGAYHKFAALAESEEVRLAWRLRPGDAVVFNNRRMLHGRAAFQLSPGAGRHLQGCYLQMEEFISRLQVARQLVGGTAPPAGVPRVDATEALWAAPTVRVGNQDFA